ncbi:UDP-N-acetylglucosamine--N-acetylmuramyl-(pentapeptide) pyrophosphoryl-undecaprenol N-acetylglucosamine transferase, partial [Candidatus Babeliales bacterium]|nr:UDP-N-acetylglucosamine--N-acetylmuramyl-(pentapeptide) pyrophosphoryl-undecaprenol N-acetylglucosamine transferase [Candidatus Babeliales bacterium]
MTSNKKTLCVVGGGSGGHVIPCLVLGKRWLEQCPQGSVVLLTNVTQQRQWFNDALSEMPHQNFSTISLSLGKRSGSGMTQLFKIPMLVGQLCASFIKSFMFLYKLKPEKVISTGGLVSLPVCLAAWLQCRPIELYELNAEPGLAVKFLAPFATTIALPFASAHPSLPAKKCQMHSYPLRYTPADRDDSLFDKNMLLQNLGFDAHRKTLLILGGSQGSVSLNKTLKDFFMGTDGAKNSLQVIH